MQTMSRPKDPRLAALFDTTHRLIELIEVENGHLDARHPEKLSETEARKEELVSDYRIKVTALGKARQAGEKFAEPDKKAVNAMGHLLEKTMTDHARRIVRHKSITEGLLQSIADQAHKDKRQVAGYGARGTAAAVTVARNAYQRPAALSVNRAV